MARETKRPYQSPARAAAAERTRAQVVETAARLLSEPRGAVGFSLDAVARAAGVTRLTVYNQFGSRRGLLEAVFEHVALKRGLGRIPEVMQASDPREALVGLVGLFCAFWDQARPAAAIYDAAGADAELAEAMATRNERRRVAIAVLLGRMGKGGDQDAIDLIFTLTGYRTFESLRPGRTAEDVARIVARACLSALDKDR